MPARRLTRWTLYAVAHKRFRKRPLDVKATHSKTASQQWDGAASRPIVDDGGRTSDVRLRSGRQGGKKTVVVSRGRPTGVSQSASRTGCGSSANSDVPAPTDPTHSHTHTQALQHSDTPTAQHRDRRGETTTNRKWRTSEQPTTAASLALANSRKRTEPNSSSSFKAWVLVLHWSRPRFAIFFVVLAGRPSVDHRLVSTVTRVAFSGAKCGRRIRVRGGPFFCRFHRVTTPIGPAPFLVLCLDRHSKTRYERQNKTRYDAVSRPSSFVDRQENSANGLMKS